MRYSDITMDMIDDYAAYKLGGDKPYSINSFVARISADVEAFMSPKSVNSAMAQAAGMLSGMGIGMAPKQGAALPSDALAIAASTAKYTGRA